MIGRGSLSFLFYEIVFLFLQAPDGVAGFFFLIVAFQWIL